MNEKIMSKSVEVFKNIVQNIVLRPNDMKNYGGVERFNNLVDAVEKRLEQEFVDTDLYRYYHFMKSNENKGFWMFNRHEWRKVYSK